MPNAEDPVADLLLRNEAVEDFKQSIDDGLAEPVGAFRDPAIIAPASCYSKIAALFNYDGGGALDRPLCEIGAAFDRDGFHGFIFPWTALAIDLCARSIFARYSMPVSTRPIRFARSRRFFTEDGAHLVPPRGVRSWSRSSWVAISLIVRSGFDEWIPATRLIKRSSGGRAGDFLSNAGSARCSVTNHFTARRRRSAVQSLPRCFSTRAISSQV